MLIFNDDEELQRRLYAPRANNLAGPRIKTVERSKHTFFIKRVLEQPVDYLDKYQNWDDLKNDLKKIIIIPIVSVFLGAEHELKADLDLFLLTLDIGCLEAPNDIGNSLISCLYELFLACYYPIYGVAMTVDAILECALRIIITLSAEIVVEPVMKVFGMRNDYADSPSAPSSN